MAAMDSLVEEYVSTHQGSGKLHERGVKYFASDGATQLTYGSGTTLTRSFDELYRIASISSGSVQNLSYTREPAGNITAITDNLNPSKSQSFDYDDLYRLTSATGPYGSIAYTYDAVGNRLTKTTDGQTDTYTYSPATNRLRSVEGGTPRTFTYDPNGNTLSENERAYAYNQHNRLTSVAQDGSSLAEYVYNGEGQRVKKSTQDETRLFHYDLSGHLIAETDGQGETAAEYVYLGDQLIVLNILCFVVAMISLITNIVHAIKSNIM